MVDSSEILSMLGLRVFLQYIKSHLLLQVEFRTTRYIKNKSNNEVNILLLLIPNLNYMLKMYGIFENTLLTIICML